MRTFPSGKANTCVEPLIPLILKTLGGQNPNGFMGTYELTAGNYEVPADIPAGKYDIVAVSGHGVFTINNTDGYADLSEFLGVDNDEYAIKEYKNAKILEGNTIEISSTLKAKLVPKD